MIHGEKRIVKLVINIVVIFYKIWLVQFTIFTVSFTIIFSPCTNGQAASNERTVNNAKN